MPRSSSLTMAALMAATLAALPVAVLAETLGLAVVAPQSGPFATLGRQAMEGARLLAEEKGLKLTVVPETCEGGSGDEIAARLTAADVGAAIGFLCVESLEDAGESLKQAGIAAISLSLRSRILLEDARTEGWPIFTLAPAPDDEAARLAEIIFETWQGVPFALIEDGTLQGRELTEAIRNRLEENGLKPHFMDTYRPGQENQVALVRRLARTGVTHVFIGGDRNDAAVIARDAAEENIPLVLLGGEMLNAADRPVPLAEGVQAVLLPEKAAGTDGLAKRARARGVEPEGYVLPAYAAARIAADALEQAARSGSPVAEVLARNAFETFFGEVRFDGGSRPNPYVLMEWRGKAFVPVEAAP